MVHAQTVRHSSPAGWLPLAVVVLSPLIIAASIAILLSLLGIFVVWLLIVGGLISAIVASDLIRRSLRRFAGPPIPLRQRAVGIPGR